jgi:hypothetical protein
MAAAGKAANSSRWLGGDELFSLILTTFSCYEYVMDNHAPHSSAIARISLPVGRPGVVQKTSFDGTKLPIVVSLFQTTSNGMNLTFQLISTTQNRAIGQRMDPKKR